MRRTMVLAALCAALAPAVANAQGLGVAVKAGTMGVGLEGALGLGPTFAIRAGGAFVPVDFDRTYSDLEFGLDLPDTYMNVGVDIYPGGGPFRISGGLLFKPDEPVITGNFTEPQNIGGRDYSPAEIGTLVGEIDSGDRAPFVAIGIGKIASSGFGLYMDVGLALLDDPKLSIHYEGGSLTGAQRAEFETRLEQERQDIEDDLGDWQRFYPIVQVGVKLGLGN